MMVNAVIHSVPFNSLALELLAVWIQARRADSANAHLCAVLNCTVLYVCLRRTSIFLNGSLIISSSFPFHSGKVSLCGIQVS